METPVVKFEAGKLLIKAGASIDTDKDTKAAAKVSIDIELDPAEVISEIAKKDMPLLETILKQVKA